MPLPTYNLPENKQETMASAIQKRNWVKRLCIMLKNGQIHKVCLTIVQYYA